MSVSYAQTVNHHTLTHDKEPSNPLYSEELSRAIGILRRRKWLILCTIVIVTALVTAFCFIVTPQYTSTIKLILDDKEQDALNITTPTSQNPKDDAMVVTEVERIRSRSLEQAVIEKLQLQDDPEFNKTLRTQGWITHAFSAGRQALMDLIQLRTPAETNTTDMVIDEFDRNISVFQVGRSRAIEVAFTSWNPEKAAAIANTLGDEYFLANLGKKSETAGRARVWLSEQLQDLKQKVQTSETAVEDYRKRQGLFRGERVSLLTEQMSDMNKRRLDAESAWHTAEANLAQAQQLLRSPDKLAAAENVFQSDLVKTLRSEEAELSAREAAFSQQYGPRHPAMINAREERKKITAEIDREINRIIARLQHELDVAKRQHASMVSGMEALKRQIEEANNASVGLRSLEREAEANRSLLEKALSSYMEASAQSIGAQLPDVSIVSSAAIPDRPSFPRTILMIFAAAILSSIIGVLLAFLIERIDAAFRTAEQVERETGLTVLAHVPLVKTMEAECLSSLTSKRPYSAFAESIRSIFTRLIMSRMRPPRTILVTSAEPDEGKSTIAMSLAKLLAETDQRVLVIDLDFFRQTNPAFSDAFPSGLVQVLEGEADIQDVIHEVDESGVFAIRSGGTFWKYGLLVDIDRLNHLLRMLQLEYDVIVLDAPPMFVTSVTQRIATMVDSTVVVVRWGHTRRMVVAYAIKQLIDYGVNIGGVVLSMVNVRVNSSYYSGDSVYYNGKSKQYYQS